MNVTVRKFYQDAVHKNRSNFVHTLATYMHVTYMDLRYRYTVWQEGGIKKNV